MVEFKNLVKGQTPSDPTDLIALFDSLDRRTSHTDPRPAQREALASLTERRGETDLILKSSTGAGKTVVGLIYLQSHMLQTDEPVVYLCPTVQLVEQVCAEAQAIGIPAVKYPKGETYAPVAGTAAKAIIVCTYEKLFNGQSTFNRDDVRLRPRAIVLDDAHVGLDRIRGNFTLKVTDTKERERLLGLLKAGCENYNPARWTAVVDGDPRSSMEVPFWVWAEAVGRVRSVLSKPANGSHNWFAWPLVGELLRWCRCILSGAGIEIVPVVLPVDRCPPFHASAHRLFMSATLADDSVLVKELGCGSEAALRPVQPASDRGVGERMVLAPSLIDKVLDRAWVQDQCRELSRRHRVVVLCASEADAREWEAFGATVAIGEDVLPLVQSLRKPNSEQRFVALAQRFDGVDLPDDACRVLVLDGLPYGEGIAEGYDSSLSQAVKYRVIHRIEQGMGRAVRSHADYAVVFLAGPAIGNFIARGDVLRMMNPDTRAQLEMALELAKLAGDESGEPAQTVRTLVQQCLGRDPDWKRYYDEKVRRAPKPERDVNKQRLSLAAAERQAFALAIGNDLAGAVAALRTELNQHEMPDEAEAEYLQQIASYLYEADPGGGLDVQRAAYEKNRTLALCPPSRTRKPPAPKKLVTEEVILRWFRQFDNPNGAIAALQTLRGTLSYENDPDTVERGIAELAPLLGAQGSRPEREYDDGPDDLWLWPGVSAVIEAKTRNEKTLHKRDAGQLVLSLRWFERSFQTRDTPLAVVAAKVSVADRLSDFPEGTRVLTWERLDSLLGKLEAFYARMIEAPLLYSQPAAIRDLLLEFRLTADLFAKEFTEALKQK